ncbi:hypothetical protein [Pedobacter mendelii]|uniref:Uncharacterized protein n=1 Tax=Pedobacter mendelii TaxID=1908240 RepID=A0ABQ2BPW2_9SPHI|nr:hypothetical protein [Pedobacter mendelii]GGI29488.1 hypothetical protein GCM10008119_37880 [Pedobacter mendelii]
MNKFENPLYSIYPRLYCSGTILVNDVPMVNWYGDDTKDGGYGGDTVTNTAILQSRKYKVVGKMLPRSGEKALTAENAYLSLDFLVCEAKSCKNSRIQFHPKIESPWDGLSENINYPSFEIQTEINVELPFELNGWQNSVDLLRIDKDQLFKKVIATYRQIYAIIAEHNAIKFLEISKDKEELQEKAFFMDEQRKQEVRQSIAHLFGEKLQLKPFVETEMKMEIFGYGKLVRLIKADGTSPFQFIPKNEEEQGPIELDVKLHIKKKGNILTII